MKYLCPVCGYDQLDEPPVNFNICDSCGTEFGYDDATFTHAALRQRWIQNGATWWNEMIAPPDGWNPVTQMLKAGFGYRSNVRHEHSNITGITKRSSWSLNDTHYVPMPFHHKRVNEKPTISRARI